MDENSEKKRGRGAIVLGSLAGIVLALGLVAFVAHQHQSRPSVPAPAPAQTVAPATVPAQAEEAVPSEEQQPPEEPEKPALSKISYPNGHVRTVESYSDNSVISYTDNVGVLWKLDPPETKDGEYVADDQKDVWHRFRADGTKIAGTEWHGSAEIKEDDSVVLHNADGTTTIFDTDGSTIDSDSANRTTMIQYANGSSRSFEYSDTTEDILSIDETTAGGATSYWKRVEKDDDAAYQRCRMENHACKLYGALYDLNFSQDTSELTLTNRDDKSTTTYYANGASTSNKTEK